jgi:hypothetical protein
VCGHCGKANGWHLIECPVVVQLHEVLGIPQAALKYADVVVIPKPPVKVE